MAIASRRRFGAAKCAAVLATHERPYRPGEFREDDVAFVVVGKAVPGEFDGDALGSESVDEFTQSAVGAVGADRVQGLPHVPSTHPVRICQCPPAASVRAS